MDMRIYIFSVCLSILGGFLRYLRLEGFFTFRGLLTAFFTSLFSGILVCCLISFLGLENPDICSVFAGVAGYSGSAFLDSVVARVCSMFFSRFNHSIEKSFDSPKKFPNEETG